MNKIKFSLELLCVPLLFLLVFLKGMKQAVVHACFDVADAYRNTKYKYGIK